MIVAGVCGFIAGVAFDLFMHWLFTSPRAPTASTTCVWCEAPQSVHHDQDTECPVRFGLNSCEVHFFKPMTVNEWMKYRGSEDGGTP